MNEWIGFGILLVGVFVVDDSEWMNCVGFGTLLTGMFVVGDNDICWYTW